MTLDGAIEILRDEECILDEDIYSRIADLLEEMRFILQWKDDVMESLCKYDCNSVEEVARNAYNRGVDDFVKAIEKNQTKQDNYLDPPRFEMTIDMTDILKVAKQLKGGE